MPVVRRSREGQRPDRIRRRQRWLRRRHQQHQRHDHAAKRSERKRNLHRPHPTPLPPRCRWRFPPGYAIDAVAKTRRCALAVRSVRDGRGDGGIIFGTRPRRGGGRVVVPSALVLPMGSTTMEHADRGSVRAAEISVMMTMTVIAMTTMAKIMKWGELPRRSGRSPGVASKNAPGRFPAATRRRRIPAPPRSVVGRPGASRRAALPPNRRKATTPTTPTRTINTKQQGQNRIELPRNHGRQFMPIRLL
mmetsp:Transcript_29818/g.62266  ORF Transcript_29818/g.62266 Transcript_29818/m.62266 type:complete len:248 (+) Transcript_29818:1212-1955(+)